MNYRKDWVTALVAGGAIGALNLAHYLATGCVGDREGASGIFPSGLPIGAVFAMLGHALSPALALMMVLGAGTVVGSGLSAWQSGELTLRKLRARPLRWRHVARAAVGGVLMGAGVMMAGGCLVRHALSGVPLLGPASLLTVVGIVGGIWLLTALEARRT